LLSLDLLARDFTNDAVISSHRTYALPGDFVCANERQKAHLNSVVNAPQVEQTSCERQGPANVERVSACGWCFSKGEQVK
jgi:hypothetical protein